MGIFFTCYYDDQGAICHLEQWRSRRFFIINNVGKNEKRLLHLCIQQLQGAAEATGGEGATTPRHRHGNAKIDLPLKIFRKIVFYHDGRL